jgi:hypothetical protein
MRMPTFTWTGDGPAPGDFAAFYPQSLSGEARTDAEGRAVLRVVAGELFVQTQRGWSGEEGVRLTLRSGERREVDLQLQPLTSDW